MQPERTAYDEKLETILRTSARIFAEKGYHQASIRDIAKATNVSLSGLYYYFDSKEELLYLVQDHAFGTLLDALDDLLKGVDDPVRRLQILMSNHLRYFVANMAEMKVLSHEAESLTGEYRRKVNAKKRRLTEVAMQILLEIRPEPAVDPRVATFSLFGMMNWIYNWYRPEKDLPVDRMAEHMAALFLNGYLQAGSAPPMGGEHPAQNRPSMWSTPTEKNSS
jgi:TetR/AcrR family transcriptional regulator, cholesterol catabolism regulator